MQPLATEVSPGFVDNDFAGSIGDPAVRAAIESRKRAFAIGPGAIGRAVAFAIEQPADVELGSIVLRPGGLLRHGVVSGHPLMETAAPNSAYSTERRQPFLRVRPNLALGWPSHLIGCKTANWQNE